MLPLRLHTLAIAKHSSVLDLLQKHWYACLHPVCSTSTVGWKRSLQLICASWRQDTKAAKEVQTLADFYAMMGSDSARAFYGPAHVLAAHELGAVQTLLLTDTLLRVNDVVLRRRYAKLVEEVGAGGGQAIVFSGAVYACPGSLNQPIVTSFTESSCPVHPSSWCAHNVNHMSHMQQICQGDDKGRTPPMDPMPCEPCNPLFVCCAGMHVSGEQLQQLTGIAAILRFPLPDLEDADIEDGQLV